MRLASFLIAIAVAVAIQSPTVQELEQRLGPDTVIIRKYIRDGAESWQLFRLQDGNQTPLDPPAANRPFLANGIITGTALANAAGRITRINPADTIDLRTWGGNFYLTVPLRVDLQQGRTAPGQQCFEMTGGPGGLAEIGCEMRVEAVRKPVDAEFTFVRLFNEANENMGTPRHVVIRKDGNIEYVAASAIVKWNTSGDEFSADLSNVWLKVRIDNSDENLGWIHTEEDFAAVGLPAARALP